MANENDTSDDGVGLAPAATGVVVGAAGGVAAANLIGSEKSVAKQLNKELPKLAPLQAARAAKINEVEYAQIPMTDEQNRLRWDNHNAREALKDATAKHATALEDAFTEATQNLSAEEMQKLHIAGLKGELSAVESLPVSKTAKIYKTGSLKRQIADLEALTPEELNNISPYNIKEFARDSEAEFAREHGLASNAEYNRLFGQTGEHAAALNKANVGGMHTANPEVAAKIARETDIHKKLLEAATEEAAKAKNAWEPVRNQLTGHVVEEAEKQEKLVGRLRAMGKINEEKGVWAALKRPFSMLKEGSTNARLAIAASVVALGALAYSGVHNSMAASRPSYADRLAQQRAAAAQAQGRGA